MAKAEILFHTEVGGNRRGSEHVWLPAWIEAVIQQRGGRAETINYIFCGDDYLHEMNVRYLNHDTLTDIITFPSAVLPIVAGDLFISTERVAENAETFGVAYEDELHRVMIHGILHLCGVGDKTEAQALEMRAAEEKALLLRPRKER